MGRLIEGSAEKEGFTLEEEAQTDGRQGLEGCDRIVSMPFLRRGQENALSLPNLRAE